MYIYRESNPQAIAGYGLYRRALFEGQVRSPNQFRLESRVRQVLNFLRLALGEVDRLKLLGKCRLSLR